MMKIFKRTVRFFDKLEDKVRGGLSKHPIVYAFVAGVGVVLFWRGVWHTADDYAFMSGPVSLIIGGVLLLISGVFVSAFIGSRLIVSGITNQKKLEEKASKDIEADIKKEEHELEDIKQTLHHIEEEIAEIREIGKK